MTTKATSISLGVLYTIISVVASILATYYTTHNAIDKRVTILETELNGSVRGLKDSVQLLRDELRFYYQRQAP